MTLAVVLTPGGSLDPACPGCSLSPRSLLEKDLGAAWELSAWAATCACGGWAVPESADQSHQTGFLFLPLHALGMEPAPLCTRWVEHPDPSPRLAVWFPLNSWCQFPAFVFAVISGYKEHGLLTEKGLGLDSSCAITSRVLVTVALFKSLCLPQSRF